MVSTVDPPPPEIIYLEDFDFNELRKNGETTAWKGKSWQPERELDRDVKPTKQQLAEAASKLHPKCDPWVVRQVAKKWRYVKNRKR